MSKILMTADVHGSWKPVRDLYETMFKKQPLTEDDVLIILGDFGANFFFNHRDIEYKKKLGKYKITYFIIRGALDTPAKYEIPTAQGDPIKTLVLPGAYSVDKYVRLANNWSWFPQEQCNEEEMAAGIALAQSDSYDLVLSHTCPIIYEPTDLFLSVVDQSTVDKTTERWLVVLGTLSCQPHLSAG